MPKSADFENLSQEARIAVMRNELMNLKDDVIELRDEIKGLRRALWATATSLLLFALTLAMTLNFTGLGGD